jgi:hypothetical protein
MPSQVALNAIGCSIILLECLRHIYMCVVELITLRMTVIQRARDRSIFETFQDSGYPIKRLTISFNADIQRSLMTIIIPRSKAPELKNLALLVDGIFSIAGEIKPDVFANVALEISNVVETQRVAKI